MYFVPLSWDGGTGVGRDEKGPGADTGEICRHSSFFSARAEGVADMMWTASGVCSSVNRYMHGLRQPSSW